MATVKEPARVSPTPFTNALPLRQVLTHFRVNRRTYACHNLGLAMLMFSSYGTSAWLPTFFIRHYHWSAGQTGLLYGVLVSIFGSVGVLGGGWFADRLVARGHADGHFRVALLATVLWFPTGIAYLCVPDARLAAVLMAPTIAIASSCYSVGPASLMQVTPARMRGQAAAIYLFVGNLIGLGVGPTAVALCTDYVFHNDDSVGYSILIVSCVAHAIAALLLWQGREQYRRSQAVVNAWAEAQTA